MRVQNCLTNISIDENLDDVNLAVDHIVHIFTFIVSDEVFITLHYITSHHITSHHIALASH